MPLRILVIGSGAREHALLWRLSLTEEPRELYAAPGNAGTAELAQNVPLNVLDTAGQAEFARREKIDLTIVGTDQSLAAGVVDVFRREGLPIFGPAKAEAMIETSKSMAKHLMNKVGIPTAAYWVRHDAHQARELVRRLDRPLVIKADGLAQGKGVYVCDNIAQAELAIDHLMIEKRFGAAGEEIVIEELLQGQELSMHAVCGPHGIKLFPLSQDYKRLTADPRSPNTGGMGAVAPLPGLDSAQAERLTIRFVRPVLEELTARGTPFTGCLYPGIMVTADGPHVLEYNARFGDPETQNYMRLLASDLLPVLSAAVDDRLDAVDCVWSDAYTVNVVLATAGYPEHPVGGDVITGLEVAQTLPGVIIFHAGTIVDGHRLLTTGGRTLSVTATGATMAEAVDRCYRAISHIHFRGMQYRDDIGQTWLNLKT